MILYRFLSVCNIHHSLKRIFNQSHFCVIPSLADLCFTFSRSGPSGGSPNDAVWGRKIPPLRMIKSLNKEMIKLSGREQEKEGAKIYLFTHRLINSIFPSYMHHQPN